MADYVDIRTNNGTVITTTKEQAEKITKITKSLYTNFSKIKNSENDKYKFNLIGIDFNLNTSYEKLKQAYGSYGKYAKKIAKFHKETFATKWDTYDVETKVLNINNWKDGCNLADKIIPVWEECNEYGFGYSYKRNQTLALFDSKRTDIENKNVSTLDYDKLIYTYNTIFAFRDALAESRNKYNELKNIETEELLPKSQKVSEEDKAKATKEISEAQDSRDTSKEQQLVENQQSSNAGFNSNAVKSSVKKTGGSASGTLDNTIKEGKLTKSAKDVFAKLSAGTLGFVGKIAKFLNSANDFINGIQDEINGFISSATSKLAGWASRIGLDLPSNNILDKLSRHYGSNLGLLDNFTKDLMSSAIGMAKDLISSAGSLGFAYLAELTGDAYDNALCGIVKSLVYVGGDVNYNNTFLKYIMICDLPKCLEFLDKKNNTVYSLETKEYARANVAAYNGCVKIPLYICKQLYNKYKIFKIEMNASGKSEKEKLAASDKAKTYAMTIAYIFKNTFVYAFSNLNEDVLKEWFNSFPDILNPSILGDSDNLYNRKYALTGYDIDIIAPITELEEANAGAWSNLVSVTDVGGFGGQSWNATTKDNYKNLSKQQQYIDPRNVYIKKCYLYLVGSTDSTIPANNRLVNDELYTRLKFKTISTVSKLKSDLYNDLLNSTAFKDIKFVLTDIAGAVISDTLETLNAAGLIMPVYNMKGSNYGISIRYKDIRDAEIPEFIDYRYTKIKFINDDESYIKNIEYGISSKLPRCEFKKEGYHLDHWVKIESNSETNVTYTDEESVVFNTYEITLKAVWTEGNPSYDTSSDDSDGVNISNDIDIDDVYLKSDELMSSVKCIDEFSKYSLSLSDFKVLDTFDKTEDQILNESNKIENMFRVENVTLNRFNQETKKYDIKNTIYIYCKNKDVFKDVSMSAEEIKRIIFFVIASNLVREYSYKYELSYLTTLYGESYSDGRNEPDSLISEFIPLFADAIAKIKEYVSKTYENDNLTVIFNLLGHGIDYDESRLSVTNLPFMCQIKEESLIDPSDDNFYFKGWYTDCTCRYKFDFASTYIIKDTILYAKWIPKENTRYTDEYIESDKFIKGRIKINYYDKNYKVFSGTHESNYITSFDNSVSTALDKPTKDGYVFIGWYTDQNCVDNRIEEIYSYTYEQELDVFARWMSLEEYTFIEKNEIDVFGIKVDVSSLSFYTSYSMADGTTWRCAPSGITKLSRNGSILGTIHVPDIGYSPKGITSVSDNSKTVYLAISINNRTGVLYLYASKDKTEWSEIMESSITYFNVFDVCGAESVINLMFTKHLIYNNILFTINDSEDKIIIENDKTMFDVNKSMDVCKNKRILGICSTVNGKFYILIDQVGVLSIDNFNDYILSGFEDELIYFGISGWKEDTYTINSNVTGTPNSSVYSMVSDYEDFDIDDPMYIENLRNENFNKTKYIKTYIKAGDETIPIINGKWKWTFQYDKYGIIVPDSAYIKYDENTDIYPSKFNMKGEQGFRSVRANRFFRTKEILDVYEPRKVIITKDNYKDYLNWSKVIFDGNENEIGTEKITIKYLKDQGIEDLDNSNYEFEWTVKYTREELVLKEIKDSNGNIITVKVYNSQDIVPSKSFERYLKKGGTL